MKIEDFQQRLKEAVLVADGATGSLLYELVGPQRSVEELNSTHAEAVFRAHMAYLEAGAQIIETNTFGANRHKLTSLGMGNRVAELNSRGVKIAREAREAAKHEVLIAGSIGPLGIVRQLEPMPESTQEIFREQAAALEERGVDLFILETFSDLEELLSAVDAIRSFSQLPVIAQLTYSEECLTLGGTRPRDAWAALRSKNIQAIGAAVAASDPAGIGGSGGRRGRGAERHAQRGISEARGRSHRLSEIIAGIFRVVRT
jgi:homocysteine S-methyltransferase